MSDPLILYDNAYENGTLTATDTATGFDVANIIDWRSYTLWKANSVGTKYLTVDLNEIENSGFETGTSSGWNDNGAGTITYNEAGTVRDGTFSCKIIATADRPTVWCDPVTVDTSKLYTFSGYRKITAQAAGEFTIVAGYLDSGGNLISSDVMDSSAAVDGNFVQITKTIGPGGDYEFPAGTVTAYFTFVPSLGASSLTAYIDDAIFYERIAVDSLGFLGHNFWDSNASTSLESSEDDTEDLGSWTERLAAFTVSDNKAILKEITARTSRAWRVKIVTANIAAYVGVLALGGKMSIPYGIQAPYTDSVESPEIETANSRGGNILGSIVNFTKIDINLTILWPTWAFMRDTFKPFWDDHGSQGKPFFYSWDNATYPEDVKFVKFTPGMQYRTPFTEDSQHPSFTMTMEGIKE